MKYAALCFVIAFSIVALCEGVYQYGRVVTLERHLSDVQVALESEQIAGRIDRTGLDKCSLELEKAHAKLDLVDAWLGLQARRSEVTKQLAAVR